MTYPRRLLSRALLAAPVLLFAGTAKAAAPKPAGAGKNETAITEAKDQHGAIGVVETKGDLSHTAHPDAQWFNEAGFGLFIHWGLSSVYEKDISWPMMTGMPLAGKRIDDPKERERIIRDRDFNLNGMRQELTPDVYWKAVDKFDPQAYDADKWIAAAKAAGFTYAVLTTRHHEGFALWPSAFGEFDTKNHMGGRDLLKPYVDACRKYGLKVGFYYSPPNWYFDREYANFLYWRAVKTNPEFPALDADLNPRRGEPDKEKLAEHSRRYAAMVGGQVEELLTRYGKIDLLWFDGSVPGVPGDQCITQKRMRELQPGLVINTRLHGSGDFKTHEGVLKVRVPEKGWAEFCNTWGNAWAYTPGGYKSDAFVLGQLVKSRSLHINYLLDVGPDKDGRFPHAAYDGMAVVSGWMRANAEAVYAVTPLPAGETASVPATAAKGVRYLYVIPEFKLSAEFKNKGAGERDRLPAKDRRLTLTGIAKPTSVRLLGDDREVAFTHTGKTLTVDVPVALQNKLVTVVKVTL